VNRDLIYNGMMCCIVWLFGSLVFDRWIEFTLYSTLSDLLYPSRAEKQ